MKSTVKSRRSFVEWYKRSSPCADCGRSFPPEALDLDHARGKTASIRSFINAGPDEMLWAELAKCDVVCACCHRTRTKNRGPSQEARENISKKGKGKPKPHQFKIDWPKFHDHQRRAVECSDGRKYFSIMSAAAALKIPLTTLYRRLKDGLEFGSGLTAKFTDVNS